MPQKEPRSLRRRTSEASSLKEAAEAGAPTTIAPRRSPRLFSVVEDRGGTSATPCRRSPRLLSLTEGRGAAAPTGGVAATPRRCPRLLSRGNERGGLAVPPGSRERKERKQSDASPSTRFSGRSPQILGLRRSARLTKSTVDPGGGGHADATGRDDPQGVCRRKSARPRGSIGKHSLGEVGNGYWAEETRNLGRKREGKKKGVSAVPTRNVAKNLGRAEFGSVVSEDSWDDLNVVKRKKREISVGSATKEARSKKRRHSMEAQEELASQRRALESGSGCPGWTGEQEAALHRSYILAKPSPHFWKKVAKLVPGKTAQECFDRMHSNIATPDPIQPRSRARMTDCSPLSFNDLFKKDPKRSKSSKKKTLLVAHKTVRHILRKHSVMDQGQEADLFSVLETSPRFYADLSQIKVPSMSGCITESNEKLSSSNKKMLSRLESQTLANYASPEVLKPVKNIALHEKYIDELHCREARRRMCAKAACSVSSEDDNENAVLKGDVVKAAKNALVSEARGIICQLGHTQSTPSSNFEDTDGSVDEYDEET